MSRRPTQPGSCAICERAFTSVKRGHGIWTTTCGKSCAARLSSARHGHARVAGDSPEYRVWTSMIQRCTNPNRDSYRHYGGRGITVCERWRKFENFLADMGARQVGMTIDRVDPNGNYEPGNCRWATHREQARNKRNNHVVTHDGVTKSAAEWDDYAGLRPRTVARRINSGWSPEEAMGPKRTAATRAKRAPETDRRRKSNRFVTHDGVSQCLVAWEEVTGIAAGTIADRLDSGWSVSEALFTPLRVAKHYVACLACRRSDSGRCSTCRAAHQPPLEAALRASLVSQ